MSIVMDIDTYFDFNVGLIYIDKNLASFWLIIQIRNWQCENEWWFVLDLWPNMDSFVKEEIKDSFYLITVFIILW